MAKPVRTSSPRPACPSCGSSLAVVRIAHGQLDPLMAREAPATEVELAGISTDDRPQWFCESCQSSFGRITDAA